MSPKRPPSGGPDLCALPPAHGRTTLSYVVDQTHVNLLGNVAQVNWAAIDAGRRTEATEQPD